MSLDVKCRLLLLTEDKLKLHPLPGNSRENTAVVFVAPGLLGDKAIVQANSPLSQVYGDEEGGDPTILAPQCYRSKHKEGGSASHTYFWR